MKRTFLLVTAILTIVFALPAFASVGVQVNGSDIGQATTINFVGSVSTDGSKYTVGTTGGSNLIAAGLANGGGSSMASTSTTIPLTYSFVSKHIGPTVGQVNTLADGVAGRILTIEARVVDGSGTMVITPSTALNWSTVTLDAANDCVILLYVDDTYGWQVIGGNSYTKS